MQLPRSDRNPICCHGVLLSAPAKIPWLNMHGWRIVWKESLGWSWHFVSYQVIKDSGYQWTNSELLNQNSLTFCDCDSSTESDENSSIEICWFVGSAGKSWWVERGTPLAPTDGHHGPQAQGGHLAWPILHGGFFLGALIHDWQVYLNVFEGIKNGHLNLEMYLKLCINGICQHVTRGLHQDGWLQ